MDRKLAELMRKIRDPLLRKKVKAFLKEPTLKIKEFEGKVGLPLEESPGGISHHHAYPRGLIQHTVAMTRLALSLCDLLEDVYGGRINRDVVIASCLLHDIMKAPTYVEEEGKYASSSVGERLDHLSLIISELYRRKFPLNVIHAVAAHHGDRGPISPRTLEALVIHLADIADSQMNGAVLNAARHIIHDATGEEIERINLEDAFRVISTREKAGREGVRRLWEKIKEKR